ncbi:hypothetical protein ACHAXH_003418 [Discostella pseudostelligera]
MKVCLLLLAIVPLNTAKIRGGATDGGDGDGVGDIVSLEEPLDGAADDTEYTIDETLRRRRIRGYDIDQFHSDDRQLNIFSGQSRIIGGTEATTLPADYSFAVSLQDQTGKHFCGASLVSKDCILTTAHCSNKVTGNSDISAVVGRYNLDDTSI